MVQRESLTMEDDKKNKKWLICFCFASMITKNDEKPFNDLFGVVFHFAMNENVFSVAIKSRLFNHIRKKYPISMAQQI